jgi:hypothetical protein
MKPAVLIFTLLFSVAAFAQAVRNRYCDFGRGCITAINYKAYVFAGAGVNGAQGYFGSFGYSLWYRIIRSNRKYMCDHHWLIQGNVAPFTGRQSFSLVLSDLWLRKETYTLVDIIPSMIRFGPSLQRLWQRDKRCWLPGAGLGLIYDRMSIFMHLHAFTSQPESHKRFVAGITLNYWLETGSMYVCSR